MASWWHNVLFPIGAAIAAIVAPAQLYASATLSDLEKRISNTRKMGDDALIFQTHDCNVLVLADEDENIGAILLHSKSKRIKVEDTTQLLIELTEDDESAEVRYSRDGYAAVILYPEIAEDATEENKNLAAVSRLVSVYNICQTGKGNCEPHRWHEGGISFRSYSGRSLMYEITPDLTQKIVPYVEVRTTRHGNSNTIPTLLSHNYGLPEGSQALRMLSSRLGGATPLSADENNDTYLTRRKDVYCLGYMNNLHRANRNRDDVGHYIFPEFIFPSDIAQVQHAVDRSFLVSTSAQQKAHQTTLAEVQKILGNAISVDDKLHTYLIENCYICALADSDGRLAAFILKPAKGTSPNIIESAKNELTKLFPDYMYYHRELNARCGIILYHGPQAAGAIPGCDRARALRTLVLNHRRLRRAVWEGSSLDLTYNTSQEEDELTVTLDLTRPTANLIVVTPSTKSGITAIETKSLLRLSNAAEVDGAEKKEQENKLQGNLLYASQDNKIFLTGTNKAKSFAAGTANEVKKANTNTLRRTVLKLPDDTSQLFPSNARKEKKEENRPAPCTPAEARKAYIDYLNKM